MATTGDIVLVYLEEKPAFFARIEDIAADRKRDWYQVQLLIFQIPVSEITWILRSEYINGEPFTVSGRKIRMEKVQRPQKGLTETGEAERDAGKKNGSVTDNVISIFDRKRGS